MSDIQISNTDAKDFIRQIANLTEKQFSYQSPILDVSAGKYRLNAVHNSLARYKEEPVINFAIRIASSEPRITDQSKFLTLELISLFTTLLNSGVSMVIGGMTGSGKTEFQKYLLRKMNENTRVIVIDNVLELSSVENEKNIDLNVWQSDDKNQSSSIQLLVKNALRSNPDWLIVAESRGAEMVEILNSALTGHPIITTIHAQKAESMPHRLARMIMMEDKKSEYKDILNDVYTNFPVHVYLKRSIDKSGLVKRYIESVVYFDLSGNMHPIYRYKNKKHTYYKIDKQVLELTSIDSDKVFVKTFGGKENENL